VLIVGLAHEDVGILTLRERPNTARSPTGKREANTGTPTGKREANTGTPTGNREARADV
jgi:hypothetical protein